MSYSPTSLLDPNLEQLVDMRRHMHRNPELSGHEHKTTEYLAKKLAEVGLPYEMGPENRGLIVNLGNENATKRIALRADIDAIPVNDSKTADYRSLNENVMHACGHDAHSTVLFGALGVLKQWFDQDNPKDVAVRAFFQPEEETARGAQAMIKHGVLENVDAVFGTHVDPSRDIGTIGVRPGVMTAHCDEVKIELFGSGGHAARPHETRDPIAAAVEFVSEAYRITDRDNSAQAQVVLTFGQFLGGKRSNVIPDYVELMGTLRSLSSESRIKTIESLNEIAARIGERTGVRFAINFGLMVPSVISEPSLVELVRDVARPLLGEENVRDIERPSMGGEDFAFYTQHVPAAFIRLGSRSGDTTALPLHNSGFDIDESVLGVGAQVLSLCAIQYLTR